MDILGQVVISLEDMLRLARESTNYQAMRSLVFESLNAGWILENPVGWYVQRVELESRFASQMVQEADEFTSLRRSSSWSRPSFWEPRVDRATGTATGDRGEHQVKDGAPRNKLQASVNSRPSSWAHSSSWVRPSSWAPIGFVCGKGSTLDFSLPTPTSVLAVGTQATHGFLLRGGLLLGRGLLLRSLRLLGLQSGGGLLFVVGAELVGGLGLREIAIGHGLLQRVQEHAVQPFLVLREVGLHVLLDGDGGGAGTVLELRDGGDDSCFVRHGDDCLN